MSEQDATQQNATQPLAQEHCLCREIVNHFREAFVCLPRCGSTSPIPGSSS